MSRRVGVPARPETTARRGVGAPRPGGVPHESGLTVPARAKNTERGAATVEFVLIFPLALALIALVLFAGWLGLTRVILDHGARQGARALSIPTETDLRAYPDDAYITAIVDAATPLISPTSVTSGPASVVPSRNAELEVTVTYQVTNPVAVLLAPIALLGVDNPAPATLTLTSTGKARRE